MNNMSDAPVFRTCDMVVGAGEPPHVEVRAENYPNLYAALIMICHDNGFGANHAVLHLSETWQPRFAEADATLAALRRDDPDTWEDFLIGDYDVGLEVRARSPELDRTGVLLDDFFGEE